MFGVSISTKLLKSVFENGFENPPQLLECLFVTYYILDMGLLTFECLWWWRISFWTKSSIVIQMFSPKACNEIYEAYIDSCEVVVACRVC